MLLTFRYVRIGKLNKVALRLFIVAEQRSKPSCGNTNLAVETQALRLYGYFFIIGNHRDDIASNANQFGYLHEWFHLVHKQEFVSIHRHFLDW